MKNASCFLPLGLDGDNSWQVQWDEVRMQNGVIVAFLLAHRLICTDGGWQGNKLSVPWPSALSSRTRWKRPWSVCHSELCDTIITSVNHDPTAPLNMEVNLVSSVLGNTHLIDGRVKIILNLLVRTAVINVWVVLGMPTVDSLPVVCELVQILLMIWHPIQPCALFFLLARWIDE